MNTFFSQIKHYPAPLRLGIFLSALAVIWLPVAIPLYLTVKDQNLCTILTMGFLFIQFLWFLPFWVKRIHKEPHPFRQFGLVWTQKNGVEWLKGLSYGFCLTWGLFILLDLLGWVAIASADNGFILIVLQGFLSAAGIALAEELLFRGWIYDELSRDYPPQIALWSSAFLFAIAHFIKPLPLILHDLPAFPGLVLLGLTLVWAKRSCRGRLGISMGIHGGLVWGYYTLNVGQLLTYNENIPSWVTGFGLAGNHPLAGIFGFSLLLILANWMRSESLKKS